MVFDQEQGTHVILRLDACLHLSGNSTKAENKSKFITIK